MFNDLNQPNQPAAGTPPVDDIFAETDKSVEAKNFSGYYSNATATPLNTSAPTEIETQKAGLSANEDLPVSSKGKIVKVALIALLIILFIGLGYLVYVKFFTNQTVEETPVVTKVPVNVVATVTPVVTEPIVTSTPVVEAATSTVDTATSTTTSIDTDSDGLTDQEEAILGTDPTKKDTDGDGLSDYDEVKTYNTNATLVDTDGDGLPDYDEVKIYKTDPNKADTDGDGHNDGEEVKNGYNPLGAGKMTDVQKASSTASVK